MREDKVSDNCRDLKNNTKFTSAEDTRLIEIVTDPSIFSEMRFAFQSGSRADVDSTAGLLVDFTWNSVIAGRYYNNFDGYTPPHRFADPNDVLYAYDPNKRVKKGLRFWRLPPIFSTK